MNLEIERRFVVRKEDLPGLSKAIMYTITQGYLLIEEDKSIRVRLTGTTGYLTIKSLISRGTFEEFEYEIPRSDAEKLIEKCGHRVIEKVRYYLSADPFSLELDIYSGKHAGIIIAEIELPSLETKVEIPSFLFKDITGFVALSNANMAQYPDAAKDTYRRLLK
jgi:CYTH domain-containing protein